MNRAVRAAASVLVLFVASVASAQPGAAGAPDPANLRGDSAQTHKRLAEAEQKIRTGKTADAVDDLQRTLDESGDDLIAARGRAEYRAARWVVHGLLAELPPDALKPYQDRIDQPAKKLLDQAKRDRDPRPLWQLLDRYFVARPAGEALLLLGDLLFERGEFRAAELQWRRLLPDAGADIVYPNSKADPALVRARIALAVIFQNDVTRAKAEVTAFKTKHQTATGTLAGKTGSLADTLQAFLDKPPQLAPDATTATAWATFGGGPDRTGRVPGGIMNAYPSRPSWPRDGAALLPEPDPLKPRPQPFGHPVILNGEAFVTDGVRLYGFDLQSGTSSRRERVPLIEEITGRNARSDTNCSLTASDGLLYARLGPAVVAAPGPKDKFHSVIACLDPKPGLNVLWHAKPPEDAVWEGAPLVHKRRLWAVYAKFDGGRVIHTAVCYDPADATADSEKSPGRPAWTTELCDGTPTATERTRQELLTLAGRNVVFCSNNGAVVALDAATGRRAWGFRYPRSRKTPPGATSDPAPAVAFGGRVFVAPADGERVYALDSETGKLVWESSGAIEGARILGVSRNRLIVALAGPLRGIRAMNLDTGSHREADGGWHQEGSDLLSYGQGLVTDDVILWPTRHGLFFLDPNWPKNGRPAAGTPNPLPNPNQNRNGFGQIAYADGVIVVVTSTQVCGYIGQASKKKPPPDAPQHERRDALIDRADRALAANEPARAISILAELANEDFPPAMRAWAAARMLQLAPPANEPGKLPVEVRDALKPALLGEWVLAPDGTPVTLAAVLEHKFGRAPAPGSIPNASAPARELCPPALTADAAIDRTLKLPLAVAPLRAIPGANCPQKHLFAAGPKRVVAVPLDQSAESEHIAADLFSHAAELRSGFVAAGPFAVAVYGADREPQWVFRVPTTDQLPEGAPPFRLRGEYEPDCPQMSSFVLAGTWLLARVGDHHLIALDLTARRVAWVLDATGRAGYEPNHFPGGPRFGPHFAVCDKFVVAQRSDGTRWFVDLRTGRPAPQPALGDRTARAWWAQPPVAFDESRLFFSDGAGLVRLAQLGGRVKWAFETERDASLTGEPAQVWARGDIVLVAIRRNHGVEIERVAAGTGKPMWSDDGPAFADADRIDFGAADADSDRAYVPAANKLLAYDLATGKLAWKADLPGVRGTKWIVRAGKSCVVAYPAEAVPAEPPGAAFDRLTTSFAREPFVWRLPALAGTLYDTWVTRAVPVMLFDPETGKKLRRFDVPARGPAVAARFGADATVIATGDRVVWIK